MASNNFANATGSAYYFNYSQSASNSLINAETKALIEGGVATAIAQADALFFNDPAFTELFTAVEVEGEEGAFEGKATSETQAIGSFSVENQDSFSFNFVADLALEAKEIENPDTEFNQARAKLAFLVLDTSNPDRPKVVDFAGLKGRLVSSKQVANVKAGSGGNITLDFSNRDINIDGNDGEDFVDATVSGTYEVNNLQNITNLTIVEINQSAVKFAGDTLIGNLGEDVIYGTIWKDRLHGTFKEDRLYSSLGNDTVRGLGGNDTLEGGDGDDKLYGGKDDDLLEGDDGQDQLHGQKDDDILIGGTGDDILVGGIGNDILTGEDGRDEFYFKKQHSLLNGELDTIKDFEIGVDKVIAKGWGQVDVDSWFSGIVSRSEIVDTANGALFTSNSGGQLLFEGVSVDALSASDFNFV